MIKLCVFDLDGTLINTLEDLANSVNYALVKNGLPERSLVEFPHFVGNGILALLERAGNIKKQDKKFEKIYDDFINNYTIHHSDKTKPYYGMNEVLVSLSEKNIFCAVLSNKDDKYVQALLQKYFPNISFYHIQGKRKGIPKKPNPQSLNNIIENIGYSKDECIFIGDSDIDVITAHNAGIKCIGAVWGFRGKNELKQIGADYLAETPIDILKYI